jgi:eukaryotic-like serine/threonine-protein kinase
MATFQEYLATALADEYRLDEEIGRGGMATVYLAHDLRPAQQRPVAIKVLHPDLRTALAAERFLLEIRVAANLAHPHIVPLHDSGDREGFLYYVMPYFEGGTLRHRLTRDYQLPVEEAVRIACDVAAALEFAHGKGVVHRDIKPENILFSGDTPIVADFGIARAVTAASIERLTDSQVQIGTPAYMSPEQASGESIDARSDIYSLGCVVYEMLTGSVPFDGLTARSILARALVDPVPPIHTVRPTVPAALERAVLKALAKAPADRFATAREFAEALRARGEGLRDDLSRESVAVLPFDNLSSDPETDYFSDGLSEEIINVLGHISGLRVAARTSSFAFRGKAVDLGEVGARLKVATVVRGSVQRAGHRLRVTVDLSNVADGFLLWSERYDRESHDASDVFAIQDDIAKSVAGRLQLAFGGVERSLLDTPPTRNLDAYNLYLKGRYHWAQRGLGLEKALECFGQALLLDPNYAAAHAGLADSCLLLAEYGVVSPAAILPRARAAVERALELAPDLAEGHCASGELAFVLDWDWARGARDLHRAIELSPGYVTARYRLALYLCLVAGEFTEAIAQARRAVELDPLAPLPCMQLGVVLMGAGRYDEAIAAAQRAIELGPAMLVPYLSLGVLYNHVGRTKEAIECLNVAARASGRHPTTLTALATCHRSLGETGKVRAIYEELSARARGEFIQKSTLAVAAAAAGQVDEAFRLIGQACDDRDYLLLWAKRHPGFSLLQVDPRMAEVYRRIGFPE